METATIFSVGFYNKIPTGALLLVSDQPMVPEGVKTEESDKNGDRRICGQAYQDRHRFIEAIDQWRTYCMAFAILTVNGEKFFYEKNILLSAVLLIASAYQCNNRMGSGTMKLKGRLVISEICAHYVVQVIDGNADTSKVQNGWKDEKRNATYDKVFTVANRCGFADEKIKEGDEFEFSFDTNPPPEDCLVCMAFYPTPGKRNAIKVIKK